MRIAVNTRFLLSHKMEGFGWFTYETVKRMVENHPEHEFIFFFDRKYDTKFVFADNVTPVVLMPQARHPILFKIWFNYSVTKALKKYNATIFFSPDGYLSLRTNCPQIGVIHDLNFEHYPKDLPKNALKYLKYYFPLFAKKANHIISVSEYSKQDIASTYAIDPAKITVAYNGASEQFVPISLTEKKDIKIKYANGEDYFIYVGAIHARKNVERLLLAFDQFKAITQSATKLMIVGENLWKNPSFEQLLEKLVYKEDVIFSGHVDLKTLTKLMGAAKALTLVSYFEGFGIPLVEAMRVGIPILTSNKTALPEIAGDAGLIVDPFSIDAIADGLLKLDQDDQLRKKLVEKGTERSKLFSWDKTASIIWEAIEKATIGFQ